MYKIRHTYASYAKYALISKKQTNNKNNNKQTKKKSVTGTLETINKKLVSCLADLSPLKGVRHFEGILQIIITSKLQIQCEKGAHFSFDFGWYSSILILPVKNIQGHGGGVFT